MRTAAMGLSGMAVLMMTALAAPAQAQAPGAGGVTVLRVGQVSGAGTWDLTASLTYSCSSVPSGATIDVAVVQSGTFAQFMGVADRLTCDGRRHTLALTQPVMGTPLTAGAATATVTQTQCSDEITCTSTTLWQRTVGVH